MFTGLVEHLAEVDRVVDAPPGKRLLVRCAAYAADAQLGESICVSGCCLTVVEAEAECLGFDLAPETLSRTVLGGLAPGAAVNLERSLELGDRLGGHLVTGHVDCVGELTEREDHEEFSTMWFRVPEPYMRHLASKGSIAVDGVSLTVVEVTDSTFSVALIPHTLAVTTLGKLAPGGQVNLETDLLAKYVERQLATADQPAPSGHGS